jgi:hypothetical protein
MLNPGRALLLTALLLALASIAIGQGTASRVTGTVLDEQGAAVPGAAVTLTNEATQGSLTTETTDSGNYVFDSIQVGIYTVTVEKPGFKKFVSTGNAANVNQPTTVNVALAVGAVQEVVQVTAAAEVVQTSSSGNFGNTVEEKTLEALPIIGNRGRNPLSFINFQPGVVVGSNTGGGIHVHGSRDRAFNFTLDGIDINDTSAGGSNFTPLRPNPDSITQFQVITSNFTADQGRSSGAQVTLVTRSGTNEFHGSAFEFYQTPRFHANEYQNSINTLRRLDGTNGPVPKPQFVQHIFGGSLGGPIPLPRFGEGGRSIYSGKTFFFVNVQLLRTSQSIFTNRTVYTADARAGRFRYMIGRANNNITVTPSATVAPSVDASGNPVFPACAGAVTTLCFRTFNTSGIPLSADPTTSRLIGLSPLPNNFIVGDGLNTGGFAFNAPQVERQQDFSMKIDHTFNERNAMYVRWSQGSQNTFGDNANTGLQSFPGLPNFVDTFRTPRNLAVNYRATLTPVVVNELVVGFNKFTFSFDNPDPNADSNSSVILNIPRDPLNPSPNVNNARTLRTFQIVDNLSWQKDVHTFKFGTNLRFQTHFDDRSSVAGFNTRESITLNTADNAVPAAFGTAVAGINAADRTRLDSFVNDYFGRIGRITQGFVATDDTAFTRGQRFLYTARYPEYDFYGQDTWKLSPRFTLDFGLRWEMRLSPRSDNLVLRPSRRVAFGETPTDQITFEEGKLYEDSMKQFAPTVGFAWDPFGSGKTSVRGNYRLAYDRTNTFVFSSFIFQSAPGLTRGITLSASGFPGGAANALLRNGLPTLDPNTSTPLAFRTPPPYSLSSLTVVDRDLTYPRTHQYGVSFQRELPWKSVIEVNYIGRQGRKLFGGYDANQVDINNNGFLAAFRQLQNPATRAAVINSPTFLINQLFLNDSRLQNITINNVTRIETGSEFLLRQTASSNVRLASGAIAGNIVDAGSVAQAAFLVTQGTRTVNGVLTPQFVINGFNRFLFQPFPQYTGAVNVIDNNDRSRYNALEIQLSRRLDHGISYQVSYTLAKSEDTRSYDPAFAVANRGTAQSAANTPFDLNNRDANYAPSDFDRRHSLQGYFTLEMPFGKGKRFLGDANSFVNHVVGGFELAGILTWTSGRPFTVYSGINSVSQVVQSPTSCNGCTPDMGSVILEGGRNFFFTQAQRDMFFAPAAGELGNTGRNFFTGPPLFSLDLTLGKRIKFDESRNLEIRVEAQNATNTPSFAVPSDANLVISSSTFGFVGGNVNSGSRKIQFAAKFNF